MWSEWFKIVPWRGFCDISDEHFGSITTGSFLTSRMTLKRLYLHCSAFSVLLVTDFAFYSTVALNESLSRIGYTGEGFRDFP
jgi:hypothetical protein